MVLLAAAVCTKAGKAVVSRQFVEMSKSRIEGLLAAFPKLMTPGKQHTFVETESVRYVYQPLDKLYMLLITTKASNILEDLETLRLFSRVIPEYCKSMEESEVVDQSFNLIFCFDEIVALGYRESVNLAQIRTFVEMDSHEEKVSIAVRQTQEREQKQRMREKAKDLQRQRVEAAKRGVKPTIGNSGGFGASSFMNSPVVADSTPVEPRPSYTTSKPTVSNKAMKLGGKSRDVDQFVDQLKSEGQVITNNAPKTVTNKANTAAQPVQKMEPVNVSIEEKLTLKAGRDGGLESMEILGIMMLHITEDQFSKIKLHLENNDQRGIQLQTHPNIDKELFRSKCQLGLKNAAKSFPLNTDIGVLKWRFQSNDETDMPLSINCWPSENAAGGCDVNIEYELEDPTLELNDVAIIIPLGPGSLVVNECEGEYTHETRKNQLIWSIPVIDANNKTGSMEFSAGGSPDSFFPVSVNFTSNKSFVDLKIIDIQLTEDSSPVKHSLQTVFFAERFEIV